MEDLGEPQASRPISFLGAAFWTFAIGFLVAIAVQVTNDARPGASDDLVNITACCVLAYSVLLFAMLRVYAPEVSVREVLGVRPVSPVGSILATIAGAATCVGMSVVDEAMSKRFPLSEEDAERIERLLKMSTVGERVVLIASVAVVIPLCEELFFRGALFGGLRRGRAEGMAVLASAAFFALSRFVQPSAVVSGFVLGLLAGWVRGRSGSLLPAVLANAAYSVVPLLPVAMGKPDYDVGPKGAVVGVVVAAVAAGLAGWIFGRDPRAERGRYLDA
jgi:membrane protease YdiL (CAAX protease family)